MKKVAVIVPVYNMSKQEKDFLKMLHSIENQTYKNREIIICDDGSNDDTYEMLNRILKGKENITLLRNEKNLNAAATRNYCIDNTSAEYIAIQDADDYSDLSRIEKQIYFLENNRHFDFVGSWAYRIENDKKIGIIYGLEKPEKEDFLNDIPLCHASITFRREILISVDKYNTNIKYGEDYDLLMRLYTMGYKGYCIQEPLYSYITDHAYVKKSLFEYFKLAKVRYKGFRNLNLLPKGFIYVFKPLISYFIPAYFLNKFRERKLR
jgi:glycosyltransferase EpsE